MLKSKIIVQTEEIYLRDVSITDIDNGWLDWVNDGKLTKYLSNSGSYTKEDLIKYLENSQLPNAKMFAICRLKDDLYIGNARLSSIDKNNKSAAYGRLIGFSKHECKNVGTFTLLMLAHYAFCTLNLNRIYTGVVKSNIASIKSNIKAGFYHEGTSRQSALINDKFEDSMQFSMLKSDFSANKLASQGIIK